MSDKAKFWIPMAFLIGCIAGLLLGATLGKRQERMIHRSMIGGTYDAGNVRYRCKIIAVYTGDDEWVSIEEPTPCP